MEFESTFAQLWDKYSVTVLTLGRKLLVSLVIVIGGMIVVKLSRRITNRAINGKLKADETLASLMRILIQYGVIILCTIMILDTFGINTTSLIALLGAAGVAIGFALKNTLSNIATGIVILFTRPFAKRDYIECGTVAGFVREMGLFAVKLETADGIYITIPNSNLWGLPLKNLSRCARRRMDITITIAGTDSLDIAFGVIRDIIAEEENFLKDPAAQVFIQSQGESEKNIALRAWVPNKMYESVYNEQMKKLKEKIQEAGLNVGPPRAIGLKDY